MNNPSWLRTLRARLTSRPTRADRPARRTAPRRLSVEHLEDRSLPSGWATAIGGTGTDTGNGVAYDPGDAGRAAAVYTVGSFSGTITLGATTLTSAGGEDAYLAKYDPDGTVVWAQRVGGGTGTDFAHAVAVDPAGNVYVSGHFTGSATFGSQTLTGDTFVAKFSTSGAMAWVKGMAGMDEAIPQTIAADATGVYTVETFFGTATIGSQSFNHVGAGDILVAKWNPDGSMAYALQLGSTEDEAGMGIALDGSGHVDLVGQFGGTVAFGGTTLVASSDQNAFVAQMDATTGVFNWARRMGGSVFSNGACGVAADGAGQVYVTGFFAGTADFGVPGVGGGTTLTSTHSGWDGFLTSLDAAGNFAWTRQLGGNNGWATAYTNPGSVTISPDGDLYVAGDFYHNRVFLPDFDPGSAATLLNSQGGHDTFLTRLTASGEFIGAWQGGGSGDDYLNGVAVDGAGAVYTTSYFSNTAGFDTGSQTATLTSAGASDGYLVKNTLDRGGLTGQAFADLNQDGVRNPAEFVTGGRMVISSRLEDVFSVEKGNTWIG